MARQSFFAVSVIKNKCGVRQMWKYYALASAVFAALTAILAKIGLKDVNSNLATAIRTTVILFLSWFVVLFSGKMEHFKVLNAKNISFLIASGLATGLSWLFYFKALQEGDAARVAPIDKLSVVLVVIFGVIFLHEKFTWQLAAGISFITAGTLFMLYSK